MTRTMGDAIHDNVASLPATIDIAAGYDTGSVDIAWTPADWTRFPNIPHVHIDQAYGDTRAIEAHVLVFDVETGAFSPDQAQALIEANTSPRPTIYVNRSNIDATIASAQKAANWKGDIWLSYPGWTPGMALPAVPAGCRYVAIQDVFATNYDLSTVLDDSWPEGEIVNIPDKPGNWVGQPTIWSNPDGSLAWFGVSADDGYAYTMAAPVGGTWGTPVKV